jgi:3-hydroxybutyryl-CoA dehydratase
MPLFYEDYEDLEIGHTWTSASRRVTQDDINRFAETTGDTNPIHVDLEYAAQSSFHGTIVHGYLTISLAAGLVYQLGLDRITSHAILGLNWRLKRAVMANDTIHVVLNLVSRRPSGSQPTFGIIERRYDVYNQNKEVVAVGDVAMLIMRRSMAEQVEPSK